MGEKYGEIKVPMKLIEKIKERIKETEFKSVDEYASFVLEEVLKSLEEESEEVFSEEDEEKVKDRLKALGYLD
ncbi:MAG: CopG family transcriptional regulator [Candidatus Methanofastidiosia archaeon]